MSAAIELRNARAMRSAQWVYDNAEPAEFDDDALTEADALEIAEGELHLNAFAIVENLQMIIGQNDDTPVSDRLLNVACEATRFDETDCTDAQLLVLALKTSPAGRELLDRLRVLVQSDIAKRAQELLDAQERERERQRDDWLADRGQS